MSEFDASYFEANYPDYEGQNPRQKLAHYHQTLHSRLSGSTVDVLDIGCGLGTWAAYLANAEPEWSVAGMDVNPEIIARNAAQYPEVRFEVGTAERGAPDERFDALTAMDVLEHVPGIQDRFGEVCKWVRSGGVVAFVVPVYDGPLGPAVRILDGDPTHIHKWSRKEWLDLAGTALTDLEWHGIFRLRLPGGHYVHRPSVRLRNIAPAIMVTGRVGIET